jgi:hypothetical protein
MATCDGLTRNEPWSFCIVVFAIHMSHSNHVAEAQSASDEVSMTCLGPPYHPPTSQVLDGCHGRQIRTSYSTPQATDNARGYGLLRHETVLCAIVCHNDRRKGYGTSKWPYTYSLSIETMLDLGDQLSDWIRIEKNKNVLHFSAIQLFICLNVVKPFRLTVTAGRHKDPSLSGARNPSHTSHISHISLTTRTGFRKDPTSTRKGEPIPHCH